MDVRGEDCLSDIGKKRDIREKGEGKLNTHLHIEGGRKRFKYNNEKRSRGKKGQVKWGVELRKLGENKLARQLPGKSGGRGENDRRVFL